MSKEHRAAARLSAVQALYQMEVTGKGLNDILSEFETYWIGAEIEGDQYQEAEIAFFRSILSGVLKDQRALDLLIDETLQTGWPLRRVEAVMRAVLRAGVFELKQRKDVPARVVVKEYVDVAAAFLAQDEVGMINAVLDHIARLLREVEFSGPRGERA
jgi:N utilization substance protein B